MKRSEMLNIIWNAINELEDGDHILKRIEEAGMLPPARTVRVENPIFGPDWTKTEHTWEPEND